MRQVILFDIDFTLINTDNLRISTSNSLKKELRITRKKYDEIMTEYASSLKSSTDFNPEDYLSYLAKNFHKDSKLLSSLFFKKELYEKSLYPETIGLLDIASNKYDLGIFTEGFISFQTQKLTLSGIDKYFTERFRFIFRRKLTKNSLSKIPKNALIIDDNEDVVNTLIDNHFNIYWLNRNKKPVITKVKTLNTLKDLLKYV